MVRYDYDRDDYTDYFREDRRMQERLERMIDQELRMMEAPQRREDPVMRVINDPTIILSPAEVKAINDPKKVMDSNGSITTVTKARRTSRVPQTGRQVIRSSGQFANRGIPLPTKRTRKKTKMDKTMSKCLKEANKRMRTKSGKLRKGKSMRDVMKLAHRLCKRS